ncbi:hypothetical protein Peur_028380 [Populus x canadensis]
MDCRMCLCDFFCLISFTILTCILFVCCLLRSFSSWMYFKNLCSILLYTSQLLWLIVIPIISFAL